MAQLYTTLNNGIQMPMVGIGTFTFTPDEAQASVCSALKAGYSLVDTANAYMNEKAVGRAIKESGLDRKDVFLETKLWPAFYQQEDIVDKTLERLQVDYIDLLLIHQPSGNYMAGYQRMVDAYKAGKVKAIGLSNFNQEQIKEIIDAFDVLPTVLQTEVHPYYQQEEMKAFLNQYGIKMQAWFPLGHGDKNLINEELFTTLAKKYNKSNSQIILRWHVQNGTIVIPGSRNEAHIKENFDIFDFELTQDEMEQIKALNKNTPYYVTDPEKVKSYALFAPDLDSQK